MLTPSHSCRIKCYYHGETSGTSIHLHLIGGAGGPAGVKFIHYAWGGILNAEKSNQKSKCYSVGVLIYGPFSPAFAVKACGRTSIHLPSRPRAVVPLVTEARLKQTAVMNVHLTRHFPKFSQAGKHLTGQDTGMPILPFPSRMDLEAILSSCDIRHGRSMCTAP